MLLICLKNNEIDLVMEGAHEEIYDEHFNSELVTQKLLCMGYYRLNMEQDCHKFVQKYERSKKKS